MKKIIALLMVAVLAVFVLAACNPKECEICGKEGSTTKVEIGGETGYACDECAEGIEALKDLADLAGVEY